VSFQDHQLDKIDQCNANQYLKIRKSEIDNDEAGPVQKILKNTSDLFLPSQARASRARVNRIVC
jgi:hypothetical protein